MVRLDADERSAKVSVPPELLSPSEVRHYLENLAEWWAAVGPDDRKALAETLFARIKVLGLRKAVIEPTPEAVARGLPQAFGLDEVEMVGARGVAPSCLTFDAGSGSCTTPLHCRRPRSPEA